MSPGPLPNTINGPQKINHYLYRTEVSLETMRASRCTLSPVCDPRQALTLLIYDFAIEHVAIDKSGHADILCRVINRYARRKLRNGFLHLGECHLLMYFPVFLRRPTKYQTGPSTRKNVPAQESWSNSLDSEANCKLLRFHHHHEPLTRVQGCNLFNE